MRAFGQSLRITKLGRALALITLSKFTLKSRELAGGAAHDMAFRGPGAASHKTATLAPDIHRPGGGPLWACNSTKRCTCTAGR